MRARGHKAGNSGCGQGKAALGGACCRAQPTALQGTLKGMQLQIATLAEPDLWQAIHAEGGIPAHSYGLAAALAQSGIAPRLALVRTAEGGMVLPHVERSWQGTTDICTWLSVSGARLWGDPVPALAAWDAHARACGWVASYIQVEPDSLQPGIPGLTAGSPVLTMDLAAPDVLAGASRTVHRGIRRAIAMGVRLEEERAVLADAFVRLYPPAMARLGASAAYDLPPDALRALALAPDALVLGAALGSELHAVTVFPASHGQAESFLTAGSAEGRELSAWLYAQFLERCRAMGVRRVNLGGGVRPGDGVYQFKARFGGTPRPLGVLRLIHDPATYAALCAAAGVDPGPKPGGGWFPAYRAPR